MRDFVWIALILITICSCKKEKVYKLSDDICMVCSQTPKHYIGADTIWIQTIFTPNLDGINDFFYILNLYKFPNNSITFYDRNKNQIANYSPYNDDWSGQGRGNGLYFYKLTIDSITIEGSVILLKEYNDYYNLDIPSNSCGKSCSLPFVIDPLIN